MRLGSLAQTEWIPFPSEATADDAELKDWTKYVAMYFINEMEYERPITDKLDKAVEEQVYDAMTKQLGYE